MLFRSFVKYIQPEFGTPAFPEPLTHSAISCSLWKFGQRAGAAGSRGGGRGRLQAGAPPPPQHGRRALQPVSASEQSRMTLQLSWSRSPLTFLLGSLLVRRSFPWHFVWLVSREQQASSAPALSRDVDTRQDLSLTSPFPFRVFRQRTTGQATQKSACLQKSILASNFYQIYLILVTYFAIPGVSSTSGNIASPKP